MVDAQDRNRLQPETARVLKQMPPPHLDREVALFRS